MIQAKGEIKTERWVYPAPDLDRLDWLVMQPVIQVVNRVFAERNITAVISCGCEIFKTSLNGQIRRFIHSLKSLHYRGRALDFSLGGVSVLDQVILQNEIQRELDLIGTGYEVILESGKYPHLHIEYDPR